MICSFKDVMWVLPEVHMRSPGILTIAINEDQEYQDILKLIQNVE